MINYHTCVSRFWWPQRNGSEGRYGRTVGLEFGQRDSPFGQVSEDEDDDDDDDVGRTEIIFSF